MNTIVGDPSRFALESHISIAYNRPFFSALGFFNVHINGLRYGVYKPDATMLNCSYERICRRVQRAGSHTVPFSGATDAAAIATAFRYAVYAPEQKGQVYFGLSSEAFGGLFNQKSLVLAPDGEEGFDDGSFILHFDEDEYVRLIGFKVEQEGYGFDMKSLADLRISALEFYSILTEWSRKIEIQWSTSPKVDYI